MINNPIWLATLILVNFLDVVMIYFVSRSALNDRFQIKKIKFDWDSKLFKRSEYSWYSSKVSKLELVLAITHAIVAGFLWYFLGDVLIMRIAVAIILVLFATLFSQRKIYDALIIYVQFFLFALFIQLPLLVFVISLPTRATQFLISQIITLIGIILLTRKYKIHSALLLNVSNKVFSLIQKRVAFKIITFIMFTFAFSLLAFISFDMGSSFSWFLFPIICIPLYGAWEVLNDLQKAVDHAKRENHDLRGKMQGLHTSLQIHVGDNETIMSESLEIMRYLNPTHEPSQLKHLTYKDAIWRCAYNVMENHQDKHGEEIQLYSTVDIKELHAIVSFADTVAMFLSLFNNAIDHGYTDFINLSDITMDKDNLMIRMTNASPHKTRSEMDKMFEAGHSTKPEIGRGHGLSNLVLDLKQRYQIDGFTAGVLVDCYFWEHQKTNCLAMLVYVVPEGKEPTIKDCKIPNEYSK